MTITSRSSGGVVYHYNRFDGEAVEQHMEVSLTMIDPIRHDHRFERPLDKVYVLLQQIYKDKRCH